jgi:dipeptidyl aminopeptidase/acylaminoacyl peptidase
MTLVELLEVPRLTDPRLSTDGRQLVFVLAEADWKENRRIAHIWRVNVDGAGLVQMTNGVNGETSPRWSPDGDRLAFTAKRGDARETQIYLLGNQGGEAVMLTRHATSVSEISWSPDGRYIYFVAADPKTEEERAREEAADDVYAFAENVGQDHLWRVRVADKVEELVATGDDSVHEYGLSRDGRQLVFLRAPGPVQEDSAAGELCQMDLSSGVVVPLTGPTFRQGGAQFSPDGSLVLYTAMPGYYSDRLHLVASVGGDVRTLLPDFRHQVVDASWSRDGQSIYFLANMGVHTQLFAFDRDTEKLTQLTNGKHNLRFWRFSPSANLHVFAVDEPTNPGDVWVLPASEGAQPRRVTRVFDYLERDYELPRQEKSAWKGADGVSVEGVLFYPLEHADGTRYPLVVRDGGIIFSSTKFGFGSWSGYVQVLTAKGYAVLETNPRGVAGYGDAFLRDMVGHYFKNAHLDVLAGVDALIRRGIADPDRLVRMGWSAGGTMTNKLITTTDRFKAASSGAGIANFVSMYAQSDVRYYRTPWFGETPWHARASSDLYWEQSPLKDIAKVKTPTLILAGEKDVRVPSPQSVELYRALKANGVATRLYIAPREPHGWRELRHQLFKMNVELEWFENYANGRSYRWEESPGADEAEGRKAALRNQSGLDGR